MTRRYAPTRIPASHAQTELDEARRGVRRSGPTASEQGKVDPARRIPSRIVVESKAVLSTGTMMFTQEEADTLIELADVGMRALYGDPKET